VERVELYVPWEQRARRGVPWFLWRADEVAGEDVLVSLRQFVVQTEDDPDGVIVEGYRLFIMVSLADDGLVVVEEGTAGRPELHDILGSCELFHVLYKVISDVPEISLIDFVPPLVPSFEPEICHSSTSS
jgi:hypothetical protein